MRVIPTPSFFEQDDPPVFIGGDPIANPPNIPPVDDGSGVCTCLYGEAYIEAGICKCRNNPVVVVGGGDKAIPVIDQNGNLQVIAKPIAGVKPIAIGNQVITPVIDGGALSLGGTDIIAKATDWIKANPVLALALIGGGLYLITKK